MTFVVSIQQSYGGESNTTCAFMEKMDKNEFRLLIKYCYLIGSSGKTTICRWCADFKRGRMDTYKAVTPKKVK